MRASLRERARPSPVPPYRRAVSESAWVNSWNSFACCSAVSPMPVSATASSTQSRPSATLRTRSATSPSFVNLQALLKRLSRNLLEPHGVRVERAQVLLCGHDEAVLVLLRELSRGADDLIDKPCQINRLGIELELAGFDLREVEHLVDETKEVSPGGIHTAQRFQRLFRA